MELIAVIVSLALLRLAFPSNWSYRLFISVVFLLVAIPLGFAVEFNITGCCGAPSSKYAGVGYLLMGTLFIGGLALLITTLRSRK